MGRIIPDIKAGERTASTKLPGDLYQLMQEVLDELEKNPETEKANVNRLLKELVILLVTNKNVKKAIFKRMKKDY